MTRAIDLTGETIEKVLELSGLPADEAVDLLGTIALRIAERTTTEVADRRRAIYEGHRR